MNEFIINKNYKIELDNCIIDADMVAQSAVMVNRYFSSHIKTNEDIQFFSSLMEGSCLSSGIGALFNTHLANLSKGNLIINPYKCGNPDLLNVSYIDSDKKIQIYKEHVSSINTYPYGGIETKCTMFRTHNNLGWGVQRIDYSKSFGWKAHHNENKHLCGIVWDFVNEIPQIVGIMHCGTLVKKDWGNFCSTENKTTGGYNISKDGIKKMKDGWLCELNDKKYINGFGFKVKEESMVQLW